MKSQRVLTVNAVALLFLLVQFASVVHSAEHYFHTSNVLCDAYIAVEKNSLDQLTAALTFESPVLSEQLSVSLATLYLYDRISVYRSRAPPAHIS